VRRSRALEFQLLVALASKPQQVFSREMLLEQGYHYKADTRLVNVHVQRLRARSRSIPTTRIVTTVRGVGYRAGSVV
jgi:two-component system response regulator MtrA